MRSRKIKRSRSKRRTRRISRKYSRTKQRRRTKRRTKRRRTRRMRGGYPRGQMPPPPPPPPPPPEEEDLPEVAPVGPHAVVAPEVGYWDGVAGRNNVVGPGWDRGHVDVQPFGNDVD